MHQPHRSLLRKAFQMIPPLDGSLHKGQAGRIGIVGGSKDYTGAPFYSGYASLRLGSDLSHVICEPSASTVIKTYSPDLMVHSYLSSPKEPEAYASHQNLFEQLLDRLHVLVVGPGLGRDTEMQDWAEWTLKTAIKKKLHLVLDADALWLLVKKPDLLRGYPNAILTPNHVEFQRLLKACSIEPRENDDDGLLAMELSKALGGCSILQKGSIDLVAREGSEVAKVSCEGSPKRCGGQGDILSGLVGTWCAWTKLYFERQSQDEKPKSHELPISSEEAWIIAAVLGSEITRTCSRLAYHKLGRSMQSSDMLGYIGEAFELVMHGHTKD
ncbi:YjeF, variant [Puccinia graminis f. sp. tritici CRL 75-36-700-3]|nr:YjeF, variant [Puccinia graminis f. sp. tritici CRL 75-36-700-3]EHS62892.1 YjeF, variant [Puccinia graminis f. sp. tritici CRL 75-36-700-3]